MVKSAQKEKPEVDSGKGTKDHLFMNVQKKKVRIPFAEIIYIESQREYIKMVTTKTVMPIRWKWAGSRSRWEEDIRTVLENL